MSATIRQANVAALLEALNTGTPSDVPPCERANSVDTMPAALPAVQLVHVGDVALEKKDERPAGRGSIMHRRLSMAVVVWLKSESAPDSVPADDASEPALSWVERVCPTLVSPGRTHRAFVEEVAWLVQSGQATYARCTVIVAMEYQHRVGDPTAWA